MSARKPWLAEGATVVDLHSKRATAIAEAVTDDEAYVRQFLATVDLSACSVYGREVYDGRAILEWYADQLSYAGQDGEEPQINLGDCVRVLDYLSCIHSVSPRDCFGHSGEGAGCGYTQIMTWLRDQVARAAGVSS